MNISYTQDTQETQEAQEVQELSSCGVAEIIPSAMCVSRSFQTKAPQDYIWDLIYMPRTVPSLNVCQASEEEIQHLLLLARCQDTIVRGYRFSELFPSEAVASFRDQEGRSLPGMRIINREKQDGCIERQIYQPIIMGDPFTVGDQKCYILFHLIPKFSAWLADCFSGLCYYEREMMAQQHAEAEKFCQGLQDACADREPKPENISESGDGSSHPVPPPYAL